MRASRRRPSLRRPAIGGARTPGSSRPASSPLAALGALALEHLVRLVLVEVGARDGDPVDHDADGEQRQQQVEQQPGDHDPREQADVERLRERVDDQRAVVLGPAVGTHLAGHQKKLEMLR